jgi:hypothetical protein
VEISCQTSCFRRIQPLTTAECCVVRDGCPAFRHMTPSEHPQPPHLRGSMENQDGTWNCCRQCVEPRNRRQRMQFLSPICHDYLQHLVSSDPLVVQLLSVIDIGMAVTQTSFNRRTMSFSMGRIIHDSFLNCVLLHNNAGSNPQHLLPSTIPASVRRLYIQNAVNNPSFQRYICLLDRPAASRGIPQAPVTLVHHLVQRARQTAPFPVESGASTLDVLIPPRPPTSYVPPTAIFNVGSLASTAAPHHTVPLVVHGNGLPHAAGQVRFACVLTCQHAIPAHLLPFISVHCGRP